MNYMEYFRQVNEERLLQLSDLNPKLQERLIKLCKNPEDVAEILEGVKAVYDQAEVAKAMREGRTPIVITNTGQILTPIVLRPMGSGGLVTLLYTISHEYSASQIYKAVKGLFNQPSSASYMIAQLADNTRTASQDFAHDFYKERLGYSITRANIGFGEGTLGVLCTHGYRFTRFDQSLFRVLGITERNFMHI